MGKNFHREPWYVTINDKCQIVGKNFHKNLDVTINYVLPIFLSQFHNYNIQQENLVNSNKMTRNIYLAGTLSFIPNEEISSTKLNFVSIQY